MYFPTDGHRLSLQNFIHNNMNFPPYKNYKEIPLPSSDFKNYVYDYSSNVSQPPGLRWSSSLVLGHPPNDHQFGQLGSPMLEPKTSSSSSALDSNFAFNKGLSSSYQSSSSRHHHHQQQQQQQQQQQDMSAMNLNRHASSISLSGPSSISNPPSEMTQKRLDDDHGGSRSIEHGQSQGQGPDGKGSVKRRGRPRGPRPVANLNRVKTFGCDTCNKFFYTRQNLQQHQRIHNGDYCYSCNQCEKRFIQLTHLNQHLNSVHAKARIPYECQTCQKSCFQQSHLQQPQQQNLKTTKKQHGERVHHHCPVCQRKFIQKARLEKHISQSHPQVS